MSSTAFTQRVIFSMVLRAGGVDLDESSGDSSSDRDKKPKKNRCHTCRKKVGLTGMYDPAGRLSAFVMSAHCTSSFVMLYVHRNCKGTGEEGDYVPVAMLSLPK